MEGNESESYSLGQSLLSVGAGAIGLWIIYSKPRVSSGLGLTIFGGLMWVVSYCFILPSLPAVGSIQPLRELLSLLFSILCVLLAWNHSVGMGFAVLFVALTPLIYQLMTILWSFEPSESWERAKVLLSLLCSACISGILQRYKNVARVTIPWLVGSVLLAGSCQYFVKGGSFTGQVGFCLLSAGEGWSSSSCRPFYFSWGLIILGTSLWTGLNVADHGLEAWITPQPMPTRPRERILHPPTIPYRALPASEDQSSAVGWGFGKNRASRSVDEALPRDRSYERMAGTIDTRHLI